MRLSSYAALVAAVLALSLAGCKDEKTAAAPKPIEPTDASIAHFCNMPVLDHPGPKGEIFLKGQAEPVWFASVRDAIAFTKLPEEPKDIAAIYVSDMGHAEGWLKPQPGGWVEASSAWYVLGSEYDGGMGGREAVSFAKQEDAARFVARFGGRLARFGEVPEEYVLGPDPSPAEQAAASGQAHHMHMP
ncbi:MAG TPA: nitrous oxide reductase accessory protein NosL [Stellaceae bacterium]|nr:nitrous oxide reductase accessory protein NosL [Stellaceae bacterium]